MNKTKAFKQAAAPKTSGFVLPFGQYRGRTLGEVAKSQRGLEYLQWAMDRFEPGSVVDAIKAYITKRERYSNYKANQ